MTKNGRENGRLLTSELLQTDPSFFRIENNGVAITEVANDFSQDIFGQEEAVRVVARSYVIAEAGFADPNRPLGVFFFLGPTGVGKTELSLTLAKYLADPDDPEDDWQNHHILIDCTDLQQSTDITKLTGAGPTWVGYGDNPLITPGQLTKPTVIVFDEFEKANEKIRKWVLPILSKGTATIFHPTGQEKKSGTKGQEVAPTTLNFRKSYIIFTSNTGANEIQAQRTGRHLGFRNGSNSMDFREVALAALKREFEYMPEFLGRVGNENIVVFNELQPKHYERIFDKFLDETNRHAQNGQPMLYITTELKEYLIKEAIGSGEYGARDMYHVLRSRFVDKAAEIVYEGLLPEGYNLVGDYEDGVLVFYGSISHDEGDRNKPDYNEVSEEQYA